MEATFLVAVNCGTGFTLTVRILGQTQRLLVYKVVSLWFVPTNTHHIMTIMRQAKGKTKTDTVVTTLPPG